MIERYHVDEIARWRPNAEWPDAGAASTAVTRLCRAQRNVAVRAQSVRMRQGRCFSGGMFAFFTKSCHKRPCFSESQCGVKRLQILRMRRKNFRSEMLIVLISLCIGTESLVL
jgi:hypothetical protein